MTVSNETRAEWAANALDTYGIVKEGRADYDAPEDMAADLITDLLHLVVGHDGDPMKTLRVAQMNFEAEGGETETHRPVFENAPALFAGMKRAITALNSVPNFRTPEGIMSYKLLSELDGIAANVPKVE